jgi:hypothetical protein
MTVHEKQQAVVVHALVQNKQGHYKNHIYCFFLGLLELRRTMSSCARITQRLPQIKAQAYHVFFVCVHSGFIQILAAGGVGGGVTSVVRLENARACNSIDLDKVIERNFNIQRNQLLNVPVCTESQVKRHTSRVTCLGCCPCESAAEP